jgi:hypothetical protein
MLGFIEKCYKATKNYKEKYFSNQGNHKNPLDHR